MSVTTLYQKSVVAPADQIACLRQLLANVIVLRLRRPGDGEAAKLEEDVRARLRAVRGLPPKPAPQAPIQLELPFVDLPRPTGASLPPRLSRTRRKKGT
jgi:hypothetical protein